MQRRLVLALAACLLPTLAQAAPPQRVVSLAPSATELLYALGAGTTVVGVTRYDDYPEAVRALPKVGGFVNPDPEAVMMLHPDLVVAVPTQGGRQALEALTRLGLHVVLLPATTLEDMWRAIAILGAAMEREPEARAVTGALRGKLREVEARYAQRGGNRGVLIAVGQNPLVAAGPGSFLAELLPLVHGHNVVQRGGAYPTLDAEALLGLKPDVIIDLSVGATNEFWQRITGLRSRVVRLDPSLVGRPGPRLPEAVELLGRTLWEAP